MKILQYVFSFFLLLIVVGCSNDPEEVINDFKKELDEVNEISQIKSAFESKGFKSVEEAAAYANSLIQDIKPISRAINEDDYVERISPEGDGMESSEMCCRNCRIRGIRCGWWCRSWYCHTTCYRYSIGNRFRWVERRLSRSCYFLLKHEKKHSDNDLLSINIHYNPTAC